MLQRLLDIFDTTRNPGEFTWATNLDDLLNNSDLNETVEDRRTNIVFVEVELAKGAPQLRVRACATAVCSLYFELMNLNRVSPDAAAHGRAELLARLAGIDYADAPLMQREMPLARADRPTHPSEGLERCLLPSGRSTQQQ